MNGGVVQVNLRKYLHFVINTTLQCHLRISSHTCSAALNAHPLGCVKVERALAGKGIDLWVLKCID